ncbi:MAG TPA: phage major capsid protein [Steroidobacteraceae bacterium]|nr:phage major capsid protein [Steroidobacteraceae bacterium]
MASPGQSSLFNAFTELVSTTYRNHRKDVADNVSKHNALFRRITQKGRVDLEDGGLSIVTPLDYQANSTYQRYSGYDVLNINAVDVLTAAEYPWRQVAVNVAASGLELRTNSGAQRIINFTKAKIKNAQRSLANGLSVDIYSDGTAANQVNGLQAIVADAGQGTVGGINAATWAFWQNVVQSAAAPIQGGSAITPGPTTIESLMLPTWIRLTRGTDMPDMIVMSDDYFSFYEQSQTSLKRYAPDDNGQGGMVSMKYKTADVFFDSSGGIPAQHAYFLNTDYLGVTVHRDANMTMMDELRSVNQDAVVIPILWQGNLVCSARFLQGVMKA